MPLPAPDDPLAQGLPYADEMFVAAAAHRAEGIEMIPSNKGYDIRFMVDGVAYPQESLDRTTGETIIQSAKNLAGMAIEERRRPQQGLFKVRNKEGTLTSWTIRTSGTTMGERLNASANEKGRWHFTPDQLGLSADQITVVKSIVADTRRGADRRAQQHGRTATMYSLVRLHDAFTNAVVTLESNPLEELEGVTINRFDPAQSREFVFQSSVDPAERSERCFIATVPGFANRGCYRPVRADSHRLYVGLTAFDTMAVLDLWLRIVTEKRAAVTSLRAIVAQRLIRLLCPTCKIAYQPDETTLRKLNLPVGRNLQSFKANTEPLVDSRDIRCLARIAAAQVTAAGPASLKCSW